jgi:hypothetical protein
MRKLADCPLCAIEDQRWDVVTPVDGCCDVEGFEAAEVRTIAHRYHAEADLRAHMDTVLEEVTIEPRDPQIWFRDPQFTDYLPRSDATVYGIAAGESTLDRRFLFDRRGDLRAAIDSQATLNLTDVVAEYVELITGQHGVGLEVLLDRTGLNRDDPSTRTEAGRRLGVSYQRIYQLEQQLQGHRDRAVSPGEVWRPQLASDAGYGWTEAAVNRVAAFGAPLIQSTIRYLCWAAANLSRCTCVGLSYS